MGEIERRRVKDIRECSDPVMRSSMAAIQRAAEEARRIAIQTGTELIIMRDGEICSLSPEEIAKLPPVVESTPDTQGTTGP
jgi:hypothetical protein